MAAFVAKRERSIFLQDKNLFYFFAQFLLTRSAA